jgi:Polyketide cyclase / dehydrase and lipid transport
MPTIRVVVDSRISPDQVLAAAHDFSERRAEVFPAVSMEHMTVHELGETWADVTEGTPAGFGINWERCRYDWSEPGTVTATVTDSNVYAFPGSSWELKTSAADGGSRVEMTWVRKFQQGFRARFWGTLFAIAGKPIFGKYARDVIANLERQDGAGARSN